jgi:hypothetical protein
MLKRANDVEILNDFYQTEMRFKVMQLPQDELGPFRLVKDIETDEDLIFVNYSPELYE